MEILRLGKQRFLGTSFRRRRGGRREAVLKLAWYLLEIPNPPKETQIVLDLLPNRLSTGHFSTPLSGLGVEGGVPGSAGLYEEIPDTGTLFDLKYHESDSPLLSLASFQIPTALLILL